MPTVTATVNPNTVFFILLFSFIIFNNEQCFIIHCPFTPCFAIEQWKCLNPQSCSISYSTSRPELGPVPPPGTGIIAIKAAITGFLKNEFDGLSPSGYVQNTADCRPSRKDAEVGNEGRFYMKNRVQVGKDRQIIRKSKASGGGGWGFSTNAS
jgi:hypothetical protein